MLHRQIIILSTLVALLTSYVSAETKTAKLDKLNGNWHLRIMDGMEVRKARAILGFDIAKMELDGFDGCNRINGALQKNSDTNITIPMLMSTKMACREPIHHWVSQRLHETLAEGFSITEAKINEVEGIILKSPSHELFFKQMGKKNSSFFNFNFNFLFTK